MNKIIILLFFVFTFLLGENSYELKLYEAVFPMLFKKNSIKVYTNEKYKSIFKNSKIIQYTHRCSEGDFIFGDINASKCSKLPIFATSYRGFKNNDKAFGAFYWRKGRPQFELNKKICKKYHIDIPKSLQRYVQ